MAKLLRCLFVLIFFFIVARQFADADIAKSLLHMISNDIGQVLDITSQETFLHFGIDKYSAFTGVS